MPHEQTEISCLMLEHKRRTMASRRHPVLLSQRANTFSQIEEQGKNRLPCKQMESMPRTWTQAVSWGFSHHQRRELLLTSVALRQLIKRYDELDCEMILAGNVWGRMQDRLLPYKTTYDTWGYPDLAGITWRLRKPTGLIQVNSVAMPCIYPVEAWREHPFHNPENMNEGIWYNQFCLESNLPVLVDASIAFYRSRLDSSIVQLPISKRIRIALGVRKRIRKRFVNNPS